MLNKRSRASVTMYPEASILLGELTKNKTQLVNTLILREAKKVVVYTTDQIKKDSIILAINNLEKAISHGKLRQQSASRMNVHKRFAKKSATNKENNEI